MKKHLWIKVAIYSVPTDDTTVTMILEQCSQKNIPFYSINKFPHEKHELSTEQALGRSIERKAAQKNIQKDLLSLNSQLQLLADYLN